MDRLDFIEAILRILDEADCHDGLYWNSRRGDGVIHLSVRCSDVFEWGTADGEDIETDEDVELLRQCLADLNEASEDYGDCYLPELYAARRRRQRPQGAWFAPKRWELADGAGEIRQLFLDAGPERPIDLFNPQTTEGVYEYKP